MKITVVSPHDDDAVFSLAEHLLTWVEDGHELTVVTVFGKIPDDRPGQLKHQLLRSEHIKAMDRLGADTWHLSFLDDVYEPRPSTWDVIQSLRAAVWGSDVVIGPCGIHHPDHKLTASAMLSVWHDKKYFYDEIPYYVQHPRLVRDRPPAPLPLRAHWKAKEELCEMYASQMGDELRRMLYVPERLRA